MKQSGLSGYVLCGLCGYDFSVDYNTIHINNDVNINKYNMKKQYKIVFKFINQNFVELLSYSGSVAHIAKVSDQTKCTSSNNEPCLARPTLIN